MAKTREEKSLDDIKNFLHKNKHLLVIVCNPATDEIITSFHDVTAHTAFRTPDNQQLNVVIGVLKKSRFENTIDAFVQALIESVGMKDFKESNSVQFIKAIGGSIKSISESFKK